MAAENPTWGAPRIHGELLKLGFRLSETTASRWVRRVPRDPGPAERWLTFLRNHREAIAAMDFFTVPTLTFGSATAELRSAWTGEGARPHTVTIKVNGGGQECPPYSCRSFALLMVIVLLPARRRRYP